MVGVAFCAQPDSLHCNTKLHLDLGSKNDKTVVDWFNFCREVCDWWMENKSEKLGGPGVIVEIEESYMAGRQKNGKGRKLGKNAEDENCTWLDSVPCDLYGFKC